MGILWLRAKASTQPLYSLVRLRRTSLVMGPDWCTSRKKWTMFSGRVNRGMCPRMTMRSKQWYTKASRLPNSLVKVSIGPPRRLARNLIIGHGTDGNPEAGTLQDEHSSDPGEPITIAHELPPSKFQIFLGRLSGNDGGYPEAAAEMA